MGKPHSAKSLKRKVTAIRSPKPTIIIVCEGKVTEPRYFQEFRALCGNNLVKIEAIGGCGVPESVVERAIEEKAHLAREARKSSDSFDRLFEVWAVFDRDQHPVGQVPAAIANAKKHDIGVAYSNPCFELWGLMHYSCYDRPGHHHETQRALKGVLHGYCHNNNPVFDTVALWGKYPDAVVNAQRALQKRVEEGRPGGDPSTTVFELTERIRKFGRQDAARN